MNYFYCQTDQQQCVKAIEIFESLLQQMLLHQSKVGRRISAEVELDIRNLYGRSGPSRDSVDVAELLLKLASSTKGSIHLIDGVDELEYEDQVLVLETFERLLLTSMSVKLLIFSKAQLHVNINIFGFLPGLIRIPVGQDLNASDVGTFTEMLINDEMIRARAITSDTKLLLKIKEEIQHKASGMYV